MKPPAAPQESEKGWIGNRCKEERTRGGESLSFEGEELGFRHLGRPAFAFASSGRVQRLPDSRGARVCRTKHSGRAHARADGWRGVRCH